MNELILIVEDEPLLAMLLANCVSSKGFIVTVYSMVPMWWTG